MGYSNVFVYIPYLLFIVYIYLAELEIISWNIKYLLKVTSHIHTQWSLVSIPTRIGSFVCGYKLVIVCDVTHGNGHTKKLFTKWEKLETIKHTHFLLSPANKWSREAGAGDIFSLWHFRGNILVLAIPGSSLQLQSGTAAEQSNDICSCSVGRGVTWLGNEKLHNKHRSSSRKAGVYCPQLPS